MQPGDVKESFANIDHARKYLKYSPKVSLSMREYQNLLIGI